MQQDAIDCATQALEKYNIEKDIAAFIKKEFDKKYNPTWHCIVGRNFGSYVTHETKHFIYFYLGQVRVCFSAAVITVIFSIIDQLSYSQRVARFNYVVSNSISIPTPRWPCCCSSLVKQLAV